MQGLSCSKHGNRGRTSLQPPRGAMVFTQTGACAEAVMNSPSPPPGGERAGVRRGEAAAPTSPSPSPSRRVPSFSPRKRAERANLHMAEELARSGQVPGTRYLIQVCVSAAGSIVCRLGSGRTVGEGAAEAPFEAGGDAGEPSGRPVRSPAPRPPARNAARSGAKASSGDPSPERLAPVGVRPRDFLWSGMVQLAVRHGELLCARIR